MRGQTATVRVLGIDVPEGLLARWRRYLAPEWQPFFVRAEDGFSFSSSATVRDLDDDLRCTYTRWRIPTSASVVWLDEGSFLDLSRPERARLVRRQVELGRGAVPTVRRWKHLFDEGRLRDQADGHRFVWWPSLLDEDPEPVLRAQVEDGQLASRHREVRESTWRACRDVVPFARSIVGSFAPSSGPNCFGTTMAAAGAAEAGSRAVHAPFEAFLRERCVPVVTRGADDEPGTVLVWRARDGLPFHSAITIGDGWGVEKPAETWWTPTIVAAADQLIRINRSLGLRLERHRLARP